MANISKVVFNSVSGVEKGKTVVADEGGILALPEVIQDDVRLNRGIQVLKF